MSENNGTSQKLKNGKNHKSNKVRVKISPAADASEADVENAGGEEDLSAGQDEKERIFRNISQMDPFEEMRARAASGGSLYGVFKKEFEKTRREDLQNMEISDPHGDNSCETKNNCKLSKRRSSSKEKNRIKIEPLGQNFRNNFLCPPDPNNFYNQQQPQRHHRSKSLVHRGKNADDRTIIKYLHDYNQVIQGKERDPTKTPNDVSSEIPKGPLSDYRRHSEATMNDRLLKDARNLSNFNDLINLKSFNFNLENLPHPNSTQCTEASTVTAQDATTSSSSTSTIAANTTTTTTTEVPILDSKTCDRYQSVQLQPPIPSLQLSPSQSVNVCRRRSFSIRQNEICNEGDDEVIIVTNRNHQTSDGTPSQTTLISPRPEISTPSRPRSRQQSWQEASGRRRKSSFKAMITSGAKDLISSICSTTTPQQQSEVSNPSTSLTDDLPSYKVVILGGPGVGKSALLQQFLTSESITQYNNSFDDPLRDSVIVNLPNESAHLEFYDFPYTGENSRWYGHTEFNCFLVLYSIIDRRTFDKAIEYMDLILSNEATANRAIILVANKNDMERSRMVGTREGEQAAETRRCEFMDISVMINHQIDELLLELISQIKKGHITRTRRQSSNLKLSPRSQRHSHLGEFSSERHKSGHTSGTNSTRESIWMRIKRSSFRRRMSKSCENLI